MDGHSFLVDAYYNSVADFILLWCHISVFFFTFRFLVVDYSDTHDHFDTDILYMGNPGRLIPSIICHTL